MSKRLTVIGILLTLVYLGGIALLRWPFCLTTLQQMPLNNLGDTLAGITGPVAILWLILGFLQQGEELRQNTDALRLQAEELKNTVAQQQELVRLSREQLDLEKDESARRELERLEELRPKFEATNPVLRAKTLPGDSRELSWRGTVTLTSESAHGVRITSSDVDLLLARGNSWLKSERLHIASLKSGDCVKFGFLATDPRFPVRFEIKITFTDLMGGQWLQRFWWVADSEGLPHLDGSRCEIQGHEDFPDGSD